jgi:Yip1 domain
MSGSTKSHILRAVNLLISPAEFFVDMGDVKAVSLRTPMLLVCLVCLLSLANVVILHRDLFGILDRSIALNHFFTDDDRNMLSNALSSTRRVTLVTAGLSAFGWFPFWLLAAIILTNFAVLAGYDYDFKAILKIAGYAMAAFLPCLLLATFSLLVVNTPAINEALVLSRGINEAQAAIVDMSKGIVASAPVSTSRYLTWIALVWYDVLLFFGFKVFYRAGWKSSLAAIGIMVVILDGGSWLGGLLR